MDDADERNNDKQKGGFTWHRYQYTDISDEEPDWDEDRYDPSAQARQSVHHVTGYWADHVDSIEMDEPQEEMYERGLEYNETAKQDVNRLANLLEQHEKSMKEEFEKDRKPIPFTKRVVNSILDDIPVAIFWFLVSAGFLLLSLLF